MVKSPDGVIGQTASAYMEYGVLGLTVILLAIICAVLLFNILRDKKNDEKVANAITQISNNQTEFITVYKENQKQHKEVVAILNETLEIERANTKECYIGVSNKMDSIALNQERLLDLVKK